MMPFKAELFAAADHTWPAARIWQEGPFTLRDGQGGGQRVSAATADGPVGAAALEKAEAAIRARGARPLFQMRGDSAAFDALLDARGYIIKDPTLIYMAPVEMLTDKPIPRVTAFALWPPLAIMAEIWATDGIGPARLAVMARAAVKTGLLARWNERPAGAGFAGVHKNICMVHGLVVLPEHRRQGVADWMMRRAAFWGQAQGATHISVLCVSANEGANALYRALGFSQVGSYHYRQSPV